MCKTSDKEYTQILLQGSPVTDVDKLYRQKDYMTEPSQKHLKMRRELNKDILNNPKLSKWLYCYGDI